MAQLIGLALIALTALIVLVNLIKGLIRGFKKTIGSLVAIVASAIIAFIVTLIICKPSSSLVVFLMTQLKDLLGADVSELLFGIESVGEVLNYYVSLIIAPFVFLVLYAVLSIILAIVAAILVKFIARKKTFKPVVHKLGGLGLGVVCGLLVSAIVLMPIVGLLGVVAEVGQQADPDMLGDQEVVDLLEDLSEDQTLGVYYVCCGWLFDALTVTNFEGDVTTLKAELVALIDIVSSFSDLSSDGGFGQEQVDSLNAVVDGLDNSPLIKHAAAGLIAQMAGSWMEGESFLGVEKIDAGELLNPIIDSVVGVLATTNKTYVIDDLHTLTGILGIIINNGLMDASDSSDMLSTLGKGGVISELMKEANKNPRMSVISDSIAQLSVRALGSTIGIPKDSAERYNDLMDEMAQILNDSAHMSYTERYAYVDERLIKTLDKYGVDVEDEAVLSITESILADLGSVGQLDVADVSEFFIIYEVGFETSTVSSGNGFDTLSDMKPTVVVNGDGTISVGDRVFENYHAYDYRDSSAYVMGKEHVDFGAAATLYSAESMQSSLITMSDIMEGIKRFSDCADPDAEIDKITDMLAQAVDIFGTDFSNMSKSDLFNNMGSLLDKMSDTEIFGSAVTGNLLTAVVQSEDVRDGLGLTNKDATNFADKLNETTQSENGSYGSTTQAVSNTIDVVDKINDSNTTKEERRESTEKLISNMTPENAELLGTMTSPSMMVNYGSSEESAQVVSDSVTTLFNNMANFQDSASSETTYQTEADAVNTLLTLAMDSASSQSSTLFATSENDGGKTGTTAAEYVELFVNSEVVSETLITTVYDEGNVDNPFNVKPTEEDKAEFSNAVNDYYETNKEGLSEEEHDLLVKKLNAVAIITNMELPFDVQ